MAAIHIVGCTCDTCQRQKARRIELQRARRAAADAGEVYVLPATRRQGRIVSKLGMKRTKWRDSKQSISASRGRALVNNNHGAGVHLSYELRMLWDTIPVPVQRAVVTCRDKHGFQDCVTYCQRKPVQAYRLTSLADFQAAVYKLWASQHRQAYGFFGLGALADVYSGYDDGSSDGCTPLRRRGKRTKTVPLPVYPDSGYHFQPQGTATAIITERVAPMPTVTECRRTPMYSIQYIDRHGCYRILAGRW